LIEGASAAMAKKQRPSELELQVLSVLWENGPSTAREVLEAMPDGKQRAYTTVLTVMQNMEKKGLLSHETRGTAHVYKPLLSRAKVLGPMLKTFVHNIFGGRPALVMQQLLSSTDVTEEELREIREMLESYEKNREGKR
jgi:predicted transcriptional regulator